jgi:cytochrome c553
MKPTLLMLLMIVSYSAIAQNLERGAQLYGTCIQCHGEKGQGLVEQEAPRIAGQHDWYIYTQLVNFKAKKRINLKMYPYIQKLSEQDYKDLAAFVSQLK